METEATKEISNLKGIGTRYWYIIFDDGGKPSFSVPFISLDDAQAAAGSIKPGLRVLSIFSASVVNDPDHPLITLITYQSENIKKREDM